LNFESSETFVIVAYIYVLDFRLFYIYSEVGLNK